MNEARRPANARRRPPVRFQTSACRGVVPQQVPIMRQRDREVPPVVDPERYCPTGTIQPNDPAARHGLAA
jgi:hypothetical protein